VAAIADRRVIVNADDYGFTTGVSAGILECVAAGVVTSVSVMVNTPGFDDGITRLRALARAPGVGLHLNLTAGAPILPGRQVPTLVDARGRLLKLPLLMARIFTGALDPGDVEREARAQLERLRSAWPAVDHLDSHQHAHALPVVRRTLTRLAATAGVRWVRSPTEPVGRHRGALRRLVIRALWRVSRQESDGPVLPTVGIGLSGGAGFADDLLGVLERVEPGVTEVVVHPGRAEPELAAWDPYLEQRDAELAALLSPRLRERLARGDLALTDFRAA